LSAIDCPTLVLTGDQDLLLPHHLSEEMAQGIAGAKLVTIPECGHMPQFERPDQTTAALVDWLRM
jgi:pimeloyl-ACP methyl ester carboxylesterase